MSTATAEVLQTSPGAPLVRTIFGLNRVARDKKKDKPTPPKKQPVAAAAESTEGGAA
jgi:hypothetical protein